MNRQTFSPNPHARGKSHQHLHFGQNDWDLLRASAVRRGVERTPNKRQHRKLTLPEENSPTAPAGIQTHNLSVTSPALYQ